MVQTSFIEHKKANSQLQTTANPIYHTVYNLTDYYHKCTGRPAAIQPVGMLRKSI